MVAKAGYVEWLPTETEQEALILETQMIAHHIPPYNNLIKGNSSYVYVKIDKHPFPRIMTTRFKKKDKATYIWPKAWRWDLRNFLRMARHLFQRRSCSNKQFDTGQVCSDYYFGQCWGRCAYDSLNKNPDKETPWFDPKLTYQQACDQSEETINAMRSLFSWRITVFQEYVEKQMQSAVEQENYERAAKLRDLHSFAFGLKEKQTVVLERDISWIYASIDTHGKFFIWVVLKIVEWRIIDVIGHHEHIIDSTQEELVAQIEREYWVTLEKSAHYENSYSAIKEKSFWKQYHKLLQENTERFLNWYTFSRFASEDPASRIALLETLKEQYELPKIPHTIECVDISHFWGEHIVWWLTAMNNWVLAKNSYKRYKIKTVLDNDDYWSIREVLLRRFSKKTIAKNDPQLFVIDWWVGQLWVVRTLKENNKAFAKRVKHITFVSIWKWEARSRQAKSSGATELLHYFKKDWTIDTFPFIYNDADRLLILLRDEAHRFANVYRESLWSKRFTWK